MQHRLPSASSAPGCGFGHLDQAELDVVELTGLRWPSRRSAAAPRAASRVCAGSPDTEKCSPRRAMVTSSAVSICLQVLVQRAAQVGEALVVDRGEGDLDRASSGAAASDDFAAQRVRQRGGDGDVDELADQAGWRRRKLTTRLLSVRPASSRGILASRRLRPACAGACRPSRSLIACACASSCACSRCSRSSLTLLRRVVGQVRGRRAGARAVDEAEAGVEAELVDQLHASPRNRLRSRRESRR